MRFLVLLLSISLVVGCYADDNKQSNNVGKMEVKKMAIKNVTGRFVLVQSTINFQVKDSNGTIKNHSAGEYLIENKRGYIDITDHVDVQVSGIDDYYEKKNNIDDLFINYNLTGSVNKDNINLPSGANIYIEVKKPIILFYEVSSTAVFSIRPYYNPSSYIIITNVTGPLKQHSLLPKGRYLLSSTVSSTIVSLISASDMPVANCYTNNGSTPY